MTAVEFLHSEYIRIFGELNPSTAQLYEIAYALEQAKEMQEQQMCDHISFGAELKKAMEEVVYENIKKEFEELVKQGKLKNYTNYKSE